MPYPRSVNKIRHLTPSLGVHFAKHHPCRIESQSFPRAIRVAIHFRVFFPDPSTLDLWRMRARLPHHMMVPIETESPVQTVEEEKPPSSQPPSSQPPPESKPAELAPPAPAPPGRFKHPLLQFLEERRKELSPLLILIHDYPDPDAIAGGCALEYLVEKGFGIQSRVVYGGIIGRMENRTMVNLLKLPVHKVRHSDFKTYPNIATVDTQPAFENNSFPRRRKKASIVLDQHAPEVPPNADLAIIDPECGAACVIVAQALLELGLEIPEKIGTALAYGILTDTLNFSRAHRPDIIRTYLGILPSCNMRKLGKIQDPPRNRHFFTILGRAIRRTVAHRGLLVAHLGEVKHPDFIAHVADFLLTYRQAKRSFCTGRYKGKLHMSLRLSRPGTSAGTILRDVVDDKNNVGGHGLIAGGSLKLAENPTEKDWEETEQNLMFRLLKRLRLPTKREAYYPFRIKDT